MATTPTTGGAAHETPPHAATPAPVPPPKPDKPVSKDMMLLLLVTDWLHGDKHHYDLIRKAVIKLLTDAGEDGAEALARLESAEEAAKARAAPVKAAA